MFLIVNIDIVLSHFRGNSMPSFPEEKKIQFEVIAISRYNSTIECHDSDKWTIFQGQRVGSRKCKVTVTQWSPTYNIIAIGEASIGVLKNTSTISLRNFHLEYLCPLCSNLQEEIQQYLFRSSQITSHFWNNIYTFVQVTPFM